MNYFLFGFYCISIMPFFTDTIIVVWILIQRVRWIHVDDTGAVGTGRSRDTYIYIYIYILINLKIDQSLYIMMNMGHKFISGNPGKMKPLISGIPGND